jgi:hypothetical protein
MLVPLCCCRACGFATTASWRNAVMAHHVGAPQCAGDLEMVVSFAGRPPESGRVRPRVDGGRATEDGDPATDLARGSA